MRMRIDPVIHPCRLEEDGTIVPSRVQREAIRWLLDNRGLSRAKPGAEQ